MSAQPKLQWFRFYNTAIDNAKLLMLELEDRWYYVELLCMKSQGLIDPDDPLSRRKVAAKMHTDMASLDALAGRLEEVGLINAETLEPCGWDEHQYAGDNSAERTRKYRENKKEKPCDEHVTSQQRHSNSDVTPPDTETDTETDIKTPPLPPSPGGICSQDFSASPSPRPRKRKSQPKDPAPGFDEFWQAYPRKVGKDPAQKSWDKLAPDDTLRQRIMAAVQAQQRPGGSLSPGQIRDGSDFRPHPATWLNGKRWTDEAQSVSGGVALEAPPDAIFSPRPVVSGPTTYLCGVAPESGLMFFDKGDGAGPQWMPIKPSLIPDAVADCRAGRQVAGRSGRPIDIPAGPWKRPELH